MEILQSDGIDTIYQDVVKNQNDIRFENSFNQVKDKNLLIFAGTLDSVSPVDEMIYPLWNLLKSYNTVAIQKLILYPTEHGLIGRRISTIKEIGKFISETCI